MTGGRTESTLILIDGVSASTGSQWNGLFYSPTLDAVQEVQIVRNSYDAQFGKSGGGVLQTNAAVFIIRVYREGRIVRAESKYTLCRTTFRAATVMERSSQGLYYFLAVLTEGQRSG